MPGSPGRFQPAMKIGMIAMELERLSWLGECDVEGRDLGEGGDDAPVAVGGLLRLLGAQEGFGGHGAGLVEFRDSGFEAGDAGGVVGLERFEFFAERVDILCRGGEGEAA